MMLRSQRRPLRLLPLVGLLAFQGCAPSHGPQGQSRQTQTQTNPIAVVGDSDDHRGFVLRGNLARIYLANGIQVIAPPQKDLVELYGDINSCRYGGGLWDTNAYLACLHNAHDVLQFPNGKILAWAKEDVPWYHGTDEPSPAASYTPDNRSPETFQSTISLTPELQQKMKDEGLKALAACATRRAREGETLLDCAAHHWIEGMGIEVAKMIARRNADVIPVST